MFFTKLSIKNPYFAIVLCLLLVFLGLVAIKKIPIEEFPEVKFPIVVISTNYFGASPDVVESDVTKPIEQAINSLGGIRHLRSYSYSGYSFVIAEFFLDINPEKALQDVRDKISIVSAGFRKEIDTPIISDVNSEEWPIMSVSFSSSHIKHDDLTDWVKNVALKKIQNVDGVGEVKIIGALDKQIKININPYKLNALSIPINYIIKAVAATNKTFPFGSVAGDIRNIAIDANSKIKDISDFNNIVIDYKDTRVVKISDVADIAYGPRDYDSMSIIDNLHAVSLDIRKSSGVNIIRISEQIRSAIDEIGQIKPKNININIDYDLSRSVHSSLNNVIKTIFEGALLTILIVFVFLKSWRSTIITGLTLPVALIGTIFAIYLCGFTLNFMSLLALSLSVGLLIDDAIVVRENIVRHIHMGKDHYRAALDGTNEIGLAVLATTLTVIAVFLPVGFMSGMIGKWFYQFGVTIVIAVFISLIVSFSLDPMLSSIWHEPKKKDWLARSFIGKVLDWFENIFNHLVAIYEKTISLVLRFKKITLLIALLILIGSFMLAGIIGGEFFPKTDADKFVISFKTATNSNIHYTEEKYYEIRKKLIDNIPEIKSISCGINSESGGGTHSGSITVDIGTKDVTQRRSVFEIMDQARSLVSNIAGAKIKNIQILGGPGDGSKPININVLGDDINVLNSIGDDLVEKIAKIKNVKDVETSNQQGAQSLYIDIDKEKASNFGLYAEDIGSTISYLFAGNKISTWENSHNGENYDVILQMPKEMRKEFTLQHLYLLANNSHEHFDTNSKFRSNNGILEPNNEIENLAGHAINNRLIPLSSVASITYSTLARKIDHFDLKRKIAVTGNIDGNDSKSVFDAIDKILKEYNLPSGYILDLGGTNQEMNESFSAAVDALLIGVIFIYFILTVQFKSFILPISIMIALPLSFVGVFVSLFLFGSTINMFSIIGIIMLMGLATKNGILLVDFINKEQDRGVVREEAIVSAGKIRLRPIIMTSFAMIFGMLPLAFSGGSSDEFRKPMAYAIIGGMFSSTILTLVILPVIYVYLDKMRNWFIRSIKHE